jgi:hypothetical protein
MLPDFRFVIGAVLALAVLATTAFGMLVAVRATHQTKAGPLEVSRNLAFDDRADWNQFYDPDSGRRFEELARKSDAPPAPLPAARCRRPRSRRQQRNGRRRPLPPRRRRSHSGRRTRPRRLSPTATMTSRRAHPRRSRRPRRLRPPSRRRPLLPLPRPPANR